MPTEQQKQEDKKSQSFKSYDEELSIQLLKADAIEHIKQNLIYDNEVVNMIIDLRLKQNSENDIMFAKFSINIKIFDILKEFIESNKTKLIIPIKSNGATLHLA